MWEAIPDCQILNHTMFHSCDTQADLFESWNIALIVLFLAMLLTIFPVKFSKPSSDPVIFFQLKLVKTLNAFLLCFLSTQGLNANKTTRFFHKKPAFSKFQLNVWTHNKV